MFDTPSINSSCCFSFFSHLLFGYASILVLCARTLDSLWQLAKGKTFYWWYKATKMLNGVRERKKRCREKAQNMKHICAECGNPLLTAKEKNELTVRVWVCMFVDIFGEFQLPQCEIFPSFAGFQTFSYAKKCAPAILANRWKIHFPKCCRPLNLQEIERNEQNILCDVVGTYFFFHATCNEMCVIVCYYKRYGEWIKLKYSNNSHYGCYIVHILGAQFRNIAYITSHHHYCYQRYYQRYYQQGRKIVHYTHFVCCAHFYSVMKYMRCTFVWIIVLNVDSEYCTLNTTCVIQNKTIKKLSSRKWSALYLIFCIGCII